MLYPFPARPLEEMRVHERKRLGKRQRKGEGGERERERLAAGLMKDVRRMLTRQSPCILLIEMEER